MATTPTTEAPAPPRIQTIPDRPYHFIPARRGIALGEIVSFAYDTFNSNKVRFALTALGMVIGTASLILVVTIGMTGRQFVLNQIQAIGTNAISSYFLGGAPHISNSNADPL